MWGTGLLHEGKESSFAGVRCFSWVVSLGERISLVLPLHEILTVSCFSFVSYSLKNFTRSVSLAESSRGSTHFVTVSKMNISPISLLFPYPLPSAGSLCQAPICSFSRKIHIVSCVRKIDQDVTICDRDNNYQHNFVKTLHCNLNFLILINEMLY